ncbi:hypothetical protein EJ06DRAFT_582081 [Trichodelitschia bisporula]|uniref:TAFII28-like protein domain-containing protein n=1 Tax=Trichodelitschia bisporula TaxID=703511 RepID=A0A6G1HWF1_9PEZI|nr:hypothetical protein EJ06DRAFT_582081 [Trichodelitschia bisporula]
MASSPPSYGNSPTIPNLTLPKKRGSLSIPPGALPKRRKVSTAGPSHLRQTSFPPETAPDASVDYSSREPSIESSVAGPMSAVSGAGGRKRKGKRQERFGSVANSVADSVADSPADDGAGKTPEAGEGGDGDEADPAKDDFAGAMDHLFHDTIPEEDRQEQNRRMDVLMSVFTPEQQQRYTIWRRVRLRFDKEHGSPIPKQSRPIAVTLNAAAKNFIGELVEMALQVRLEWLAACAELPNSEPLPPNLTLAQRTRQDLRGPLTPDHLREAYRRYKLARMGGTGGIQGLSGNRLIQTRAAVGGKRVFR